ncbi:MAG: gamma-glutamylcyclotransferase [Desulfobulbaceae bacterium]|nr:gamma-glutamylcyclotransferase [Desulfobulbaceae bacterium]
MSVALFTYGTLMVEEIMAALAGKPLPSREAVLKGFQRFRMRGEIYPGIGPATGHETRGRLYVAMDDETMALLDAFEGEQYHRQPLTVTTADGTSQAAETYLLASSFSHCRTDRPWEIEQFTSRHLTRFLVQCRRFRAKAREAKKTF